MTYRTALHSTRAYRYVPAIAPYSAGVAAEPGHDIAGVRFATPPPLADGFATLDGWLERQGLAPGALVGLELRSPQPFEFGSFETFNAQYREFLVERDLLEQDANPIARSNLAPVDQAPEEPVVLSAFAVRPSRGDGGVDFVVAGSGEVDEGRLDRDAIVALGDLSQEGLARKARHVLDEMRTRLAALGHDGRSPNLVNVYTAHDIAGLPGLVAEMLPATHRHGFVRWLARPPVVDIEFEMDLRHVSTWHVL